MALRIRKYKREDEEVLGLDSLTDIVTNSVGLLIVLGIFVALGSLARSYVFQLPLPAKKAKLPAVYMCKSDHLIAIEPSKILELITAELGRRESVPVDEPLAITLRDAETRVQLLGEDSYGWPRLKVEVHEVRAPRVPENDLISDMKRRGSTANSFAFFWIYPSCFETYVAARHALRQAGYEVGFSPHDDEHPPFICTSSEDCQWEPS